MMSDEIRRMSEGMRVVIRVQKVTFFKEGGLRLNISASVFPPTWFICKACDKSLMSASHSGFIQCKKFKVPLGSVH